MLYRFKTKNRADVIMLEPNGRQALEIMGKDPGPQGIILSAEMPAAIQALRAAVLKDEADEKARQEKAEEEARERNSVYVPVPPGVTLRHRVLPLVDLLQRCHEDDDDIVWGV